MSKFTRRDFIKVAGASAAAASLSSCLPEPAAELLEVPEPQAATLKQSDWIPTVCRICPAGCGVQARVVEGRVVKMEGNSFHPLNQGKPCPRAQAAMQVLYDPDRIQQPLRRVGERGEGEFEPISWDEALAQVAEYLEGMQAQRKTHQLVFLHDAPPGHMRELITRFVYLFGSANAISADDWGAERLCHQLTQGWFDLAAHNWEETNYAIFFGGSFLEDWQPQVQMLRAYSYIRRGRPGQRGRIVQVGPRFSVSAVKADEWVPILPGRQGALALGMAHVIVRERLYQHDFISDHTENFDRFSELVLEQYDPETVAGLTGIPAEMIKRLAREFAGSGPAVAVPGRGLTEATNELFNQVAIHALNALVGSIDIPGGILQSRRPPFTPWPTEVEAPAEARLDGAGGEDYPLAANVAGVLPQRILAGNPYLPEALFLYETNPFYDAAYGQRWRTVRTLIPFIVSFSSFLDESTLYADLVLPNHTFLERWVDGCAPGGIGAATVGLGRPVVEPRYDTRHTGDLLLDLAQRLGGSMAEQFPWSDFEALLRFRAQGLYEAGGSIQTDSFDEFWSELVQRGVWAGPAYAFGKWEEVLTTSSGRYQFRLDPLQYLDTGALNLEVQGEATAWPHYEPPQYAGDKNEYPLHLIPYRVVADAGCRAPNAPLLWELYGLHLKEMWQSWVEINPETAERLEIHDGDQVWVESPQDRIKLKARIYEGSMPDVVCIPMGGGHTAGGRWASQVGGGNVAELVVPQTDPLSGSVAWSGTRVRVYPAEERS